MYYLHLIFGKFNNASALIISVILHLTLPLLLLRHTLSKNNKMDGFRKNKDLFFALRGTKKDMDDYSFLVEKIRETFNLSQEIVTN